MLNVIVIVNAYTFHILEATPRPAISMTICPIMALQMMQSIVDSFTIVMSVLCRTILVWFTGYNYSSLLEKEFSCKEVVVLKTVSNLS